MSSLVFCLTPRLHLNLICLVFVDSETHLIDCDPESKLLFLVFLFLSLYSHIRIYVFYNIFPGTDKTSTGLNPG